MVVYSRLPVEFAVDILAHLRGPARGVQLLMTHSLPISPLLGIPLPKAFGAPVSHLRHVYPVFAIEHRWAVERSVMEGAEACEFELRAS